MKMKLAIVSAIAVAAAVVGFSLFGRTARSSVEGPRIVSMEASAQELQRAGAAMQAHADAMLADGQRVGDPALTAHGEHWREDGQILAQRGQWLAMDPLAPSSLSSTPAELSTQGAWGSLTSTAAAMLHDPGNAREVDLEALRWNGLAMRAEGRNMAEHGTVMAQEVELMVAGSRLAGEPAADLRQAAQRMREVGGYLEGNGQSMVDYADRLRQSLGVR
jgi:hypothetical protein